MAKLGRKVESEARGLASLWGNTFGHVSASEYQRTVGIMKQILAGDEEKGVPAYTRQEIGLAIEQLEIAEKCGLLNEKVRSPGLIKWVISKVVAGEFLSEQKSRIRRIKIE